RPRRLRPLPLGDRGLGLRTSVRVRVPSGSGGEVPGSREWSAGDVPAGGGAGPSRGVGAPGRAGDCRRDGTGSTGTGGRVREPGTPPIQRLNLTGAGRLTHQFDGGDHDDEQTLDKSSAET